MPKFDHHLHSARHSPDSVISTAGLIAGARAAGLDGLVITDHDHQWEPNELADLARQADGLVILSGAEISAREGHFLVYGLPSLDEVPVGVSLAEILTVADRHGAAVVAAHPYRWGQDFDAILLDHGPAAFAGIELVSNNVTVETRALSETLLARHPTLGRTGSSDAHEAGAIGCYYTEFPGPIATIADFVSALKRGGFRPGHRANGRLACGPVVG